MVVGDIVVLNSGGPKMFVSEIKGMRVACEFGYPSNGKAHFDKRCLQKVGHIPKQFQVLN